MTSFFEELRRRNVVKVAAAYAIVGWLSIEVASVLLPTFQAPEWVMRVFSFFVLSGFPVALVLSWAYELTPEGLKKDEDVVEADPFTTTRTGQALNYSVIAILVVSVGYLVWERQRPSPPEMDASVQTGETVKTIAVLPFVNLSDDPEQEFFSDGIAEELLNVLAKVQGLRVTSRTSAFSFKGSNKSIPEIAAELGVQYVLEGSVRRGSEQVRITTQLIDVETDSHLWSETYDRRIENIFAVQDEIAGRVSDALEVALLGADAAPLEPVRETSPEVYSDYLLARQLISDASFDRLSRAAALFESVIARDPNYAPAYGALAFTHWRRAAQGSMSIQEAYERMRILTPRALELDDTLAEAWIMQANVEWIEGSVALADLARDRALELGPENEIVLAAAIYHFNATRKPEPARRLASVLVRVDPLGPESLRRASQFHTRVDERERARELLEKIHGINSESAQYYWEMHDGDHLKGQLAELVRLLKEVIRIDPLDPEGPGFLAHLYIELGDMELASAWSSEALDVGPAHSFSRLVAMYLAVIQNDTNEAVRIAEMLIRDDSAGRMGSRALALSVIANRDLATGRADEAIVRYLQTYPGLAMNQIPINEPQDTWPHLNTALYAALDLVHVYRIAGDIANADSLLDAVERELPYWPRLGNWGIGFADVELFALRGDRDEALRALRATVDDDLWLFWRWRLLHNPNLESLHGDREFQAIVEQIEAKMARELENSETMAEGA